MHIIDGDDGNDDDSNDDDDDDNNNNNNKYPAFKAFPEKADVSQTAASRRCGTACYEKMLILKSLSVSRDSINFI